MLATDRGEARLQTQDTLDAIRALFGDLKTAQGFGRLYVAGFGDTAGTARLLDLAAAAGGTRPLRHQIARRRAEDFAAGNTAVLDGWVFSHTEARLFALTTLS